MTFDQIRERLFELENQRAIPSFDVFLLSAVLAHIKGDAACRSAYLSAAYTTATGTQRNRLVREVESALDGDLDAFGAVWLDAPGIMTKVGYALLRVAWEHVPRGA